MKKKFLIITTVSDSLPFFKGQINVLKQDYDIQLASSPGVYLNEMCDIHSVIGHEIPMRREISLFNDFISLIKLIGLFLKEKPFVVHGNTPKASLLTMIAAWITRVPKRIYYVHGLRYHGEIGSKRRLLIQMERISCMMATNIIAVSEGVKITMEKDKITKKEINLIWNGSVNGINLDYFNPADVSDSSVCDTYKINKDDFTFGFIGRLVGDKGTNELISAFSKISKQNKKVKLLLVGSFENDLDSLKVETIKEMENNENIIHAGFQKDVRSFLTRMDVFVLPSYREGLCLVLMEAGAMNTPSISSNIVGCKEVIDNNVNGLLIKRKNVEDLQEKMEFCINNPDEIKRMSALSRNVVKEKFEQTKLWQKSLEVYKNIVND